MKLEGGERLVLKTLRELQGDSTEYVDDARLASAAKMIVADLRDWLETLEGKGLVERARGTEGFSAYITAKGKQALRLTEPIPTAKPAVSEARFTPAAPGDLLVTASQLATTEPSDGATAPRRNVMTKGERLKAVSHFLTEAFSRSDFVMFLKFRGYDEIALLVNPDTGKSQFCFEVTEVLERMGRIDAQFFNDLLEERSARAKQINALRTQVLE